LIKKRHEQHKRGALRASARPPRGPRNRHDRCGSEARDRSPERRASRSLLPSCVARRPRPPGRTSRNRHSTTTARVKQTSVPLRPLGKNSVSDRPKLRRDEREKLRSAALRAALTQLHPRRRERPCRSQYLPPATRVNHPFLLLVNPDLGLTMQADRETRREK
jgi:hypothetical protein